MTAPVIQSPLPSAEPLSAAVIGLDELAAGQCAQVCRIDSNNENMHRLMAMGLCLGRRVRMIRRGDPLIVHVLATRVGISARLARCIQVELCPAVSADNALCGGNPR